MEINNKSPRTGVNSIGQDGGSFLDGKKQQPEWVNDFVKALRATGDEQLCSYGGLIASYGLPDSPESLNELIIRIASHPFGRAALELLLENRPPDAVSLDSTKGDCIHDCIQVLGEKMPHGSPVRSLSLCGMTIGKSEMQGLATLLGKMPALTKLSLTGVAITKDKTIQLAKALRDTHNLVELKLKNIYSRRKSEPHPMPYLLSSLVKQNRALKVLRIGVMGQQLDAHRNIVSTSLKITSLKTLKLDFGGGLGFELKNAEPFVKRLKENTTLRNLSIIGMKSADAAPLLSVIAKSGSLKSLELDVVGRGPLDWTSFISNCSLSSLKIGGVLMSIDEAGKLLHALCDNTTLHTLKLPRLDRTESYANEGLADDLASMLAVNSTLEHLHIPTRLDHKSLSKIAEALGTNNTLITLSCSEVPPDGKAVWEKILARLTMNMQPVSLRGMKALFTPVSQQNPDPGAVIDMAEHLLFDMVMEMDPSIVRQLAIIHELAEINRPTTPAESDPSTAPQSDSSLSGAQEPSNPPKQSYPPT